MKFPLKNLPVVCTVEELQRLDGPGVLAMEGFSSPSYGALTETAEEILRHFSGDLLALAMEQDMAKALGQILALRLGSDAAILCIDRVRLQEGSYLDVGAPVGPALPVVVKTLILSK